MKLGIAVVYLVKEGDEGLLDLHLSQIARCTHVPYTCYAAVNRLAPHLRARLARAPRTRIVDIRTTAQRGTEEHAYYLEWLVKTAVQDGVTHVATLHIDSFPVRDGWAEDLASRLTGKCVLAAVTREEVGDLKPHPSLMFFHRDFYLASKPSFLLGRSCRSSPEYRRYRAEYGAAEDTGIGYGFDIFRQELSWYRLLRTNRVEDHYAMAGIYGDLVFHLGAATRGHQVFYSDAIPAGTSQTMRSVLRFGRRCLSALPQAWQDRIIRGAFPAHQVNAAIQVDIKKKLLADPDAYIRRLRTGLPEATPEPVLRGGDLASPSAR
ncbi:MAG TPA: hypothetical protein VE959_36285 [Bryobacteraceae bacterium]|nr:hypothetical protein [Bryobacteraceae bacterium]